MANNRRKKKKGLSYNPYAVYAGVALVLLLVIVGLYIVVTRYTPTKEVMALSDFFVTTKEDEAAVILDGEYKEVTDADAGCYAIFSEGQAYIEINFMKEYLDDGYVYDSVENILRYCTDVDVYTATLGSSEYTIDKSRETLNHSIVLSEYGTVFVSTEYAQLLTDFNYVTYEDPNRIVIERVGYEKKVATLKRKTQLRRFGGVKSKILEEAIKGETVSVLEDYGKWSLVLSDQGVIGCVQNRKMTNAEDVVVEAKLPERNYQHISIGSDITLAWHQVMNATANSTVADALAKTQGVDVMCPTWFHLKDNAGGISNNCSSNYVNQCHAKGIQVWGLVSNVEDASVDTTTVLNTTSSRDALVNNLIAAAITYDLDGINVDIESLSSAAADGYIQFIRELSLKCEKNDIILSVDDYVPTASTMLYNRKEQAKYCDYICIMAYDEHYGGSDEAGSVASIGFVEDGVKATLEEVPAEQVIMGMPLYCRVWKTAGDGSLSSSTYGIGSIQSYIKSNGLSVQWSDECGQNYAEYTKGDAFYQIWIEDCASIEEKCKVMEKYNLAGAAFWKLGFDTEDFWNTVVKYL